MKKLHAAIVLILMMLGHNYVINQPQSLQKQIQQIHQVNVTQFNLLYSIPSFLALLAIIPVGVLYYKFPNFTLLFGVSVLFLGQLLVSLFGSEGKQNYFAILVAGRTFQASGAEVLYMIQGNLASSWMSNLAGLIFILPQVGQILNAFFTPYAAIHWGVKASLWLGIIFCLISAVACWYLYCHLKKVQQQKNDKNIQMLQLSQHDDNKIQIQPNTPISNKQISPSQNSQQQSKLQNKKQQKVSTQILSEHTFQNEHKQKTSDQQFNSKEKRKLNVPQPQSIFKAGKVFWLTILLCAINQCLYFPFLDNANELIQMRFKIPYQQTGFYLCLPFIAASKISIILVLTALSMIKILDLFQRKNLILYTSFLPFLGHLIIVLLPNCQEETLSASYKFLLALGFFVFGTGIGGYYSVSFPAVGLAVPQKIRGLSYGVLGFCQTLAMSLVPILSGLIIEEDVTNQTEGYRHSSMMFVGLTLGGVVIALIIQKISNQFSFCYDDQKDLVQEQSKKLVSSHHSQQSVNLYEKKTQQITNLSN